MRLTLALTLAVFFASGFAALLYQVVWQRLLAIFSGADVYSATVIVAAFMAGLGLGNMAGGLIADRVTRRRSLILFAGAEAAVGVFGVLSAALYYGVLYQRLGTYDLDRWIIALLLFASLLWPTFFMGASLPLLSKAVTFRLDRAAFTVGSLYGFNTLGAACGALASTWLLLPRLGLEGSVRIGALLNLLCALATLPLAWRIGTDVDAQPAQAPHRVAETATHLPLRRWMVAYACAGFIALSYELVWFRLLGVIVKSTAFTFGTLLALYLSGIGLGSVIGSRLASRVSRPERLFFLLQAGVGVCASLLLIGFVRAASDVPALVSYLGRYEPLSVRESIAALRNFRPPVEFLSLYVLVPSLLVIPPTLLMGGSFPVMQRIVHDDASAVGRRVGALLVANIIGSIAGTVLTGGWLLTALGTAGTLKLLTLLGSGFMVLALRDRGPVIAAVGALAVAASGLALPGSAELWARLHGTAPQGIVYAEDTTGLSVIKVARPGTMTPRVVFVNGMGQSLLPYGDIHTALGALPVLVHPNPREVAIIGLGSGDTVFAAASRLETERILCVEIIAPQLTTLRELARRDSYAGLHGLLDDTRVSHLVGDGRAFLLRTPQRFDVIEADALRPTSAYSGNLYSEAYFQLVRSRLKPNGIAITWAPTRRIHNGFVKVFPHVVSLPGMLLGSNEPIAVDPGAMARRLSDGRIRAHFAMGGIDIDALMKTYVPATPVRFGPDADRSGLTDVNTDLFPKDEFDLSPP